MPRLLLLRLLRVLPGAAAAVAVLTAGAAVPAGASGPAPARAQALDRHIEVVQVQGAIDGVVADLIRSTIRRAQDNGAGLVVFQVDSPGSLDVDHVKLIEAVAKSHVPIAAWIGPGKAQAGGLAAALASAGGVLGATPAAHIGPVHDIGASFPRLSTAQAVAEHFGVVVAPTLGDFIVSLNGRVVYPGRTAGDPGYFPEGVTLHTTRVVQTKKGPRQTADEPVIFLKLNALASVQHSLTSPAVALLLLVVGLALIVFEFFTIGVGLAGAAGAGALAGSLYGYSHLPTPIWALALLGLSTLGFTVDVQAGHQGFWTGVGVVGFLAGGWGLYRADAVFHAPLWLVVLLFVGQILFVIGGMTVAIRNRFAVPTVGRDSMIGETGRAHTDLDPEGVVTVRGAPWRARTGRGRPVAAGGKVKIVAVDRLVLQVEPGELDGSP